MQKQFEEALTGLLNFTHTDAQSEEYYDSLLRQMITSSMQICSETDFAALVSQKAEEAEKKFEKKMDASDEKDPYKRLREIVRFEMREESLAAKKEFEICCTDSNFSKGTAKFRPEIEKIVPKSSDQKPVIDSICYSLYSDFTKFFLETAFDLIADSKIYAMKEFRPLQLNAIGKELRMSVKALADQKSKPQKSQTITDWFRIVMSLPAFLFQKNYAINFIKMFENSEAQLAKTKKLFEIFSKSYESFAAGDEYKILREFLKEMDLEDCFTVREKTVENMKIYLN